jgi:hypothetical protein
MSSPTGAFSAALSNAIESTSQLKRWISADQERKTYALYQLSGSIQQVLATSHPPESYGSESSYFGAAIQMQSGYLLLQAQSALENNQRVHLQQAETYFTDERAASQGEGLVLRFEKDLQTFDERLAGAMDDKALLDYFQVRTVRTLDNMVSETKKVLSKALEQIKESYKGLKDTVENFFESLGDLLMSFSSGVGDAVISGIEKIADGLNKMIDLLKIDGLKSIVAGLKEFVQGLDADHMIGNVFGCESTKTHVRNLKLSKFVDRAALERSSKSMAELSRQYVFNLQQMGRVSAIVSVVGGGLLVTGIAPHYVGPALPVAHAVVALVILAIGVNFAERKMRAIIPEFKEA